MRLEYWHILRDKHTGKVKIIYTHNMAPEYLQEEFNVDVTASEEVPLANAEAETIVEIMENMLEDNNYHRVVGVPSIILNALKSGNLTSGLSYQDKNTIMYNIFMKFCEEGLC